MAFAALIPAAISAVSAGVKYFGNKSKKKKEEAAKKKVESNVDTYQNKVGDYQNMIAKMLGMPTSDPATADGSDPSAAGAGATGSAPSSYLASGSSSPMGGMLAGMFAPQTSTSTSSSSTNQYTRPEISAAGQPMANTLRSQLMGDLGKSTFINPNERSQKLQGINAITNQQNQSIQNLASKHGVSSDVLGLGGPAMKQRAQSLASMDTELNDKDYTRKQAARNAASQFLGQFDTGQRSTGNQSTSGTQTGPANYGAIMQALGMLAPQAPTTVV
jgi:hypothetical protein